MKALCLILMCVLLMPFSTVRGAETVIYKKAGERELKLLIEKPADWKASDQRPAIVFYFGGGWVGGNPGQFLKQSEYLATRGMIPTEIIGIEPGHQTRLNGRF